MMKGKTMPVLKLWRVLVTVGVSLLAPSFRLGRLR